MPGRKYSSENRYRYGFNGKENDNEVKGEGNQQDYGMRVYDPRLGRFLSTDPYSGKFPGQSPYVFSGNNPILFIEHFGQNPTLPPLFNPMAFINYVGFANPFTLWGFENAKNSSLAHLQKAAWYSSLQEPFIPYRFHNVNTNWNTLYGIAGEIDMVERFYLEIAPNQVIGNPLLTIQKSKNCFRWHSTNSSNREN